MKDRTAFTSVGAFQFFMALSLVGSIFMAPGKMRRPRYSTSVVLKVHLESLRASYCSQSRSRTCFVHSWWRMRSSDEWINMLSM